MCLSIEGEMRPGLIIVPQTCTTLYACLNAVFKWVEINTRVLKTSPKSFNKHVIHNLLFPFMVGLARG